MSVLSGKKVLLGVTAGIAAYKSTYLVRLLIKKGAEVKVVMTPSAKEFVTPLTLSTLSKNEVFSSFTNEDDDNAQWNNHVELGLWADFFIIAPATANTLSKMAQGQSDNLLVATYLSAKCPVYIAPAMDLDMYKHPSTLETLSKLESFGNAIVPAEHGELASGLVGKGRMAEPENIVAFLEKDIADQLPLKGKKIVITAGPTYEAIDPVRFIGNHSSGKMGYAIAEKASELGAEVVLVSGPTSLQLQAPNVSIVRVTSAQEMYDAVHLYYPHCHTAILSAAVADYRPKNVASEKIKKKEGEMTIELEKTQDILASLGKIKDKQFLVGFALETQNELDNAKTKLEKKNLDLIVLNSLKDKGAGFGTDTNKVTFITRNNKVIPFEVKSKKEVAYDILQHIIDHIDA
ncbi:bifunctional phosphopantothenoylcysteine decarboxylase/phosphopantothenate--cysteine ligase CoaBC [Aureisphaera galaxeae]|uniref:bifunctional phosphopantothenoylcysteine decarboxylase/phosphopantothenate--cysteine ligase CoaBC n=1 Tax=Aureisphaera galaxeae TaxID=1538023 RepID=UPI0023508AC1|nr:bifunctional phosphopantothenoylcysteine decarboxylase/phosphopantothenate--cysteine ligase CoaBC [Aureisphaera galaxeae]MDC8004970.1 bifunctional phosphopantothenoylcysteine decarboxylase/phosphopantothenate--cysteine ligase CoaBC [Aureisphaera galaxeae]